MKILISVGPGIQVNENRFVATVLAILNDPRSWGVQFEYSDHNPDVILMLSKASDVKRACRMTGLSCAILSNPVIIHINLNRWRRGSRPSCLDLTDYRTYVINHEIGHALGFGHYDPSPGKLCPVMTQQTLGIGKAVPNPWPTSWEKILLHNKI